MASVDQRPHVVVGIPSYSGLTLETTQSLIALLRWLEAQGLGGDVIQLGQTEISRSRNRLVSHFLDVKGATHLLFIDSDMIFAPEAVAALLKADQPLVGAVYPKRTLKLDALIEAARRLTNRDEIIASALEFVVHPEADSAQLVDGRCKVAGVGMGLTLVRRDVFEKLIATRAVREDQPDAAVLGLKIPIYGFFDPIADGPNMFSEDLSFCRRWRTLCGGEVWAVLDQDIGHVGPMVYRGRIIDAFTAAARKAGRL